MTTKNKKKRKPEPEPSSQIVIYERLKMLDEAANAAVESIEEHVGMDAAVQTVVMGLCTSAANMVWHGTTLSEEQFIETARKCFRRIATGHATCERAAEGDETVPLHHVREDLN